jgi:hypothetical protein
VGKGIGKTQRDIIAAGGATKTVWEVMPIVPFGIAHDSEMPGLRQTGTWRADGKPYFEGGATAASFSEYADLVAKYRYVWAKRPAVFDVGESLTQEVAAAMWFEDSAYVAMYPDLFAVDRRALIPRESLYDRVKRGPSRLTVSDEVRRAKAAAKANIVRAMQSLVKRSLVSQSFFIAATPELSEARGWKLRYGRNGRAWGNARFVLHPDAIAKPAE